MWWSARLWSASSRLVWSQGREKSRLLFRLLSVAVLGVGGELLGPKLVECVGGCVMNPVQAARGREGEMEIEMLGPWGSLATEGAQHIHAPTCPLGPSHRK